MEGWVGHVELACELTKYRIRLIIQYTVLYYYSTVYCTQYCTQYTTWQKISKKQLSVSANYNHWWCPCLLTQKWTPAHTINCMKMIRNRIQMLDSLCVKGDINNMERSHQSSYLLNSRIHWTVPAILQVTSGLAYSNLTQYFIFYLKNQQVKSQKWKNTNIPLAGEAAIQQSTVDQQQQTSTSSLYTYIHCGSSGNYNHIL